MIWLFIWLVVAFVLAGAISGENAGYQEVRRADGKWHRQRRDWLGRWRDVEK